MLAPFCPYRAQCSKFFCGFSNIFRNVALQPRLLVLIEFPNMLHWKSAKKTQVECGLRGNIWAKVGSIPCYEKSKTGIINRLFHFFAWEIYLKAEINDQKYLKILGQFKLVIPYLKEISTKFWAHLGEKWLKVVISKAFNSVIQCYCHIISSNIVPIFLVNWNLVLFKEFHV